MAAAPFDFDKSRGFVCGFAPMEGEQRADERGIWKALRIRGRTVLVGMTPGEHEGSVACTLQADAPIDDATYGTALARVRFVLSLDDDVAAFYARAAGDAELAPVVAAQRGHHHVKFPSAFEIACWAVLGQRTPMRAARRMKDALVARLGGAIARDGLTWRAFPEAEAVAAEPAAAIASIVGHARKGEAIAAIARAFANHPTMRDDAFLRDAPLDDAERWLRELPLVGPWSSAFILFRGLGRMERLTIPPDGKSPIAAAARRVYGESLRDVDVARIAEGYGAWCGYWSLYLRVAAGSGAHG